MVALSLAELGVMCLFLLMVAVWLFGTSAAPGWARDAWWKDRPPSSAASLEADGSWSKWRVAGGIVGVGLLLIVLAAPLLGLMLGWLLNRNGVLVPAEAAAVILVLVAQLVWGVYVFVRAQRSPTVDTDGVRH